MIKQFLLAYIHYTIKSNDNILHKTANIRGTTTTQKPSLCERLGGEQKLRKIVNDILDKNFNNPQMAHHFRNTDMNKRRSAGEVIPV